MNTIRTHPAPAARPAGLNGVTAFLAALLLAGVAVWHLETSLAPVTPYSAPALELVVTGAVPAHLSFGVNELANADVTTAGFRFTTFQDAPFAFRLEFQGAADASSSTVYLLNAHTYPLTLTLLEDGRAYRTFTAYEGTVRLSGDGGSVAAFLNDETGRQVFLSARFEVPNAN